jgi:hypothetical protein
MGSECERIRNALQAFLAASPSESQKPLPGLDIVSRPEELDLLDEIENAGALSKSLVSQLGHDLELGQAYLLLDLAVRTAIFAARAELPHTLHNGALFLVLDGDLLDYRDVLRALSIVEDCAQRLGSDLGSSIEHVISLATETRRRTIMDYLRRSPAFRGLRVMGFVATGSGLTLSYSRRYS